MWAWVNYFIQNLNHYRKWQKHVFLFYNVVHFTFKKYIIQTITLI